LADIDHFGVILPYEFAALLMRTGLQELLEKVYDPNAKIHMMSGKSVARTVRGHFLIDIALHALLDSETFGIKLTDVPVISITNGDQNIIQFEISLPQIRMSKINKNIELNMTETSISEQSAMDIKGGETKELENLPQSN
jgi:hypothetical protein